MAGGSGNNNEGNEQSEVEWLKLTFGGKKMRLSIIPSLLSCQVYGRSAHLYALELKKKKELAEVEGKEMRKEMGQNSGNPQGNPNNFKKQKYHHNNNNFNNNNNFHNNNRQGRRNFNRGPKNSNQENNKDERCYFCKRCRNNHPSKDYEGNLVTGRACNKLEHREYECFSKDSNRNKQGNNQGRVQRNFEGNNNYAGTQRGIRKWGEGQQ
ncbi:probable cyclin-dependent serine/threonine-protein kinase DDB_G0292550 [Chenopodium quinoa]|uniref:probable cyclin-dependent serine/threonine-protein kinase DDB_G0292550 n=1 Tax=Chenopodium quinoa TaxID=63459 RepID=UPI000B794713|nr:probable cyclin-dependent serine/threonine-protein kinase DDB_G0292550 [Chenopodium quinoa]